MAVYKALRSDAEIDSETALLQAAKSLDAAGVAAEKVNDFEGLMNVAAMWMKMSEAITQFTENVEERQEVLKSAPRVETGFQRSSPDPEIIVGEETDD